MLPTLPHTGQIQLDCFVNALLLLALDVRHLLMRRSPKTPPADRHLIGVALIPSSPLPESIGPRYLNRPVLGKSLSLKVITPGLIG